MKRVLLTLNLLCSISMTVTAQSYYMHEAAEDSDGSAGGGIVALLIVFGIGTLITKMFGKDNDND